MTKHARVRAQERFDIGPDALQTWADDAFLLGKPIFDLPPRVRSRLTEIIRHRDEPTGDIKVLRGIVYVFKDKTLLTVYPDRGGPGPGPERRRRRGVA